MKKKPLLIITFSLLIVVLAISYFVFYRYSENKLESKKAPIKILLSQAENFLGYSTQMAFKKASEALLLSKAIKNEESVIQALELLAKINDIQGNTKQALILNEQALSHARKKNLPIEIGKITLEIGKLYYNWGQYDTAIIFFNNAHAFAEKNNNPQLISDALSSIGKYYRVKGQFDKAMDHFQKALDIARANNNIKQVAVSHNTIGKYYISEGDLISALQSYQEAYATSEKLNDKLLLADVCNHLGGLYLLTDQHEKALEFHRKALTYRFDMDNPEGCAKSFNNIGKSYLELMQLDSALQYFNQSLELCKKTGYKKGMVKALTNIGKVYSMNKNVEQAETILLQAFEISRSAGYKLGVAESSQALGNLYQSTQSVNKALNYYQISLKNIENHNFDELLRINYHGLYQSYNQSGDYKNALKYHELLLSIEKKLLNVENRRQLAILQISFNTERKEKDNQVLRKDNELKAMDIKRKNTFLWLIVALLFSSLLLSLFIYNRFYIKASANKRLQELNAQVTSQNKALEKLIKELNTANKEKDKLFSIIAHELRNPLYWFQNLAEVLSKNFQTMKPEKIQKSLLALDESAKNAFHLMDNLLQWSRSRLNRITPRKTVFSLNKSIVESLKMFETIIQYKEIKLQIDIPNSIEVYADNDLLSCVVRNLVSNAIKYTPNEGSIIIECSSKVDFITVSVTDTGTGIVFKNFDDIFEKSTLSSQAGLMHEKGSGLGLKLCKEFVELNGGNIWLTNNYEQGTRFMFTIINGNQFFINILKEDVAANVSIYSA